MSLNVNLLRGSVKVAPVINKLRSGRLAWYEHVMHREEIYGNGSAR